MKHPSEAELALLAGKECGAISRYRLNRHVRECRQCTESMARFEMLRGAMTDAIQPELDWETLESEMRANIRLGLEAGACVRLVTEPRPFNPRLAVAFASLMILAAAGVFMKGTPEKIEPVIAKNAPATILEATGNGLELRSGTSSLTLMNHHGTVADQTANAQGEIRARYVEGGSVTINSAYLE